MSCELNCNLSINNNNLKKMVNSSEAVFIILHSEGCHNCHDLLRRMNYSETDVEGVLQKKIISVGDGFKTTVFLVPATKFSQKMIDKFGLKAVPAMLLFVNGKFVFDLSTTNRTTPEFEQYGLRSTDRDDFVDMFNSRFDSDSILEK